MESETTFLQVPNPPMVSKTFLHLKHLSIKLCEGAFSPDYDCFSAVSFLDAAPSLETLLLGVSHCSSCNGIYNTLSVPNYKIFFLDIYCFYSVSRHSVHIIISKATSCNLDWSSNYGPGL